MALSVRRLSLGAVAGAGVVLLGASDCGPIAAPPNPDKINQCVDATSCSAFCKGGLCLGPVGKPTCSLTAAGHSACLHGATDLPPFVLVIDLPSNSQYAPEQTFALTSGIISATQNAQKLPGCNLNTSPPCCQSQSPSAPVGATCVPLATLKGPGVPGILPFTSGFYALNSSFVAAIFGVPMFGTDPVTLPVQFASTPGWTIAGSSVAVPPRLLGLPLPTIQGSIVSPFVLQPAPPGPGAGGGGTPNSIGWTSYNFARGLPAEESYSQSLEVLPPFQGVPPVIDPGVDPWSPASSAPVPTTVCVDLPSSAVSRPEGWTVFFREVLKQRVVSSVASLSVVKAVTPPHLPLCSGISTSSLGATVFSFFPDLPTETVSEPPFAPLVVVSPPPGLVMPTLIEHFTATTVPEVFHDLPRPAKVSGHVIFGTKSGGTNVSASLHFVSTSIYLPEGVGCARKSFPPPLYYDVVVETDPKNVGSYSVTLPEGEYSVTINPDPTSGAPQGVAPVKLPLDLAHCPPPADGITGVDLYTGNAIGVTGTVRLPGSGGPLPFATVDLTAALAPLNLTTPPAVPTSVIDSPRSFEVTTDAEGSFRFTPDAQANVGPGLYDLTVRPVGGTDLPWVVSQAHEIASDARFHITVPAPAPLTLTLHDPSDNPIFGALVRAYAFPCAASSPCSSPASQIGEAFTDATGSFQMLLAPDPFVPGK